MPKLDWDSLRRDLTGSRCILMLGPRLGGMKVNGRWDPLIEGFSAHLSNELTGKVEYETAEKKNLPYIAQQYLKIEGKRRVDLEDVARIFFGGHQEMPPIYEKIAGLPFTIFVDTTPDNFLEKALLKEGKEPIVFSYNFMRDVSGKLDDFNFSAQRPLVFNLLGTLDDPESLVLTESDQVDFIKNVVRGTPKIPAEILKEFNPRKTYLFLGFNMENWQFRLLLDSLNLEKKNTTISSKSKSYPLRPVTRFFFEERFNFHFIDKEEEAFVGQLEKLIASEEQEKKYRVYIAYSEKDKTYLEELEKHLKPLERNGRIETWHRGLADFGAVDQQLQEQLARADIVLLLLSIDFLSDLQVLELEFDPALAAHREGKTKALPVILRPCGWAANQELRMMKPVPRNGQAVEQWPSQDSAFQQVIQEFQDRIREWQ